ncbi:MAG: nucleotide exchange factor GrpE [Candidatus Zambryskibacteria bacterium CG_4_9_14_3_um_filter_42_9]|uniref:Protein GrpE n=1 Tax=Candidatus Zambryskibacteria bacterium CG22_combo_CG10-13_8_21_14_all_42_17 TaxID=1975118 RepID=A0A2H0BG62_9BACT|nr:MAG: nucleotide exchange factor GrpE [Candidatus Zambryskibacteria bacterium CG22_combo_CG10-13_8_21_14_all_42_17]PJA36630.1 MAG: nucleotide exchange factor GrpE [Candidatus Zambryskibacteria bacterium CG_4_9_14_3_um_filter_42_9]
MDEENDIELDKEDLDDSVVADERTHESLKKLREKLKASEAKAKEYLDGWQRAQADFVNLRRRDEESKVEFIKFAKLSLIEELIPVLDSFNIALAQGHKDLDPLCNQLMAVLKVSGLEELNPENETFSPYEHEALTTVMTNNPEEDHKVLEILQKGYKLNGKLIRPAKVKVGEYGGN